MKRKTEKSSEGVEHRLLRERLVGVIPHPSRSRRTFAYVEALYEDLMYDGSIRLRTELKYQHHMTAGEARMLDIAAIAIDGFTGWAKGLIRTGDPVQEEAAR